MPNKNVNESQTEEKAYWDERERKKWNKNEPYTVLT